MHIPGSLGPEPVRSAPVPQGTRVAPAAGPLDSFVASGGPVEPGADLVPQGSAAVASQPVLLPEEPAPRLERPVLFVHGYMGHASDFDSFTRWLGRDEVNRSGGVLQGADPGPVDPQANFFVLRYSSGCQTAEACAQELKAAVEAICQATGAPEVDVVAHSKGGIDVRQYLMDPEEKLSHVVQISVPNRGILPANLETWARKHGFSLRPKEGPEATECIKQLRVDKEDRHGQPKNPFLHQLNDAWDLQQSRADFMSFTGNGLPTMAASHGLTLLGDDAVPRDSAEAPNAPVQHVWFKTHANMLNSQAVLTGTAAFLTGQDLGSEQEIFESPQDRARAVELGLVADPAEGECFLADSPRLAP